MGTLREKLESDPNALMMTSKQARDIAVAFLTRGARIALKMALQHIEETDPYIKLGSAHLRALLADLEHGR